MGGRVDGVYAPAKSRGGHTASVPHRTSTRKCSIEKGESPETGSSQRPDERHRFIGQAPVREDRGAFEDLTQTNLSAEERKKLKKKLKKQRQKQRKKGALEEVTESQFDVLRLPDGTVARCSLQGMIAANFEDDAVPSTPEPLQDEIQRMVLRVADDVEEGSLRARVAFVAPWAKVYGALGPDHRRKPYVPEALDRAQWRCALDGADGRETAVLAVRGDGREPQTDRVLARAAAQRRLHGEDADV